MNPAGHFDGATERDFTVALAEVKVAYGEAGTVHVHREIHLGATGQILDVTVATVFPWRHGTGGFGAGSLGRVTGHLAHVGGLTIGQCCQFRHTLRIGRDQSGFTLVPGIQQFFGGQAANQARVNQAGKFHIGNVPGFGEHAVEVPDGFLGLREVFGQEATAVLLGEEAVKAPLALFEGADVEDVDFQQVARLRALDPDRSRQEVNLAEINIAHVVGAVVVLDLAAGPVIALNDEIVARLDGGHQRNIRVPAVVDFVVLIGRLVQIDLDNGFSHSGRSLVLACTIR